MNVKKMDDCHYDVDGCDLIKQSYAAASLKLHVYYTINQNLQNISLSL